MGNTASSRRGSRASVTSASSAGAVDRQLAQSVYSTEPSPGSSNADAELPDLDTFDDNDALGALPSSQRAATAPTGNEKRRDPDTDTLCDTASIMTATTDARTLCGDSLPAYVAGSSVVAEAVNGAMAALNDAKGWRRAVALAQLEWLAADGARRARWVSAEASARQKRARRQRRGSAKLALGGGSGGGSEGEGALFLSLAGEERVVAEDTATARRVGMEAAAGEERAAAESAAKDRLAEAHAEAKAAHSGASIDPATANADPEAFQRERGALRAAEELYHRACAFAQEIHTAALQEALVAHERAWSAAKVQYMGARLRDPDGPGGVVSIATAAAGGLTPSTNDPAPNGTSSGLFSGQYKVGRWGR